jgi:hypothetical protein
MKVGIKARTKVKIEGALNYYLFDNGSQPAEGKSFSVFTGDDRAAHLNHDALGLLQFVSVEKSSLATASVGRRGGHQIDAPDIG